MRINTNVSSLTAQENAVNTNNAIKSSLEKLSSGLRINKASDDASGLAIADKLRTQATSINQGVANGNSAVSLLQIADKSMAEQSNILNTVKSKLIQANTDTTSAEGREAIRKDISKLLEQLDNIAEQTNYNGKTLLQAGSGDTETDRIKSAGLAFQIGESNTDIISNKAIQSNTDGLGLAAAQETTATLVAKNETEYSIQIGSETVSYTSDKDATIDEIHAGLKSEIEKNTVANKLVQVEPQDKSSSAEASKLVMTAVNKNEAVEINAYINASKPEEAAKLETTKTTTNTAGVKQEATITIGANLASGKTATIVLGDKTFSVTAGAATAMTATGVASALATAIQAESTDQFDATAASGAKVINLTQGEANGQVYTKASTTGGTISIATTTTGVKGEALSATSEVKMAENTTFSLKVGTEEININTNSLTGTTDKEKTDDLLDKMKTQFDGLDKDIQDKYTMSIDKTAGTFKIALKDDSISDVTKLDVSTSTKVDTGKISLTQTDGSDGTKQVMTLKGASVTAFADASGHGTDALDVTIDGTTFTVDNTEVAKDATGGVILEKMAEKINAATGYSAEVSSGNLVITADTVTSSDVSITATNIVGGATGSTTPTPITGTDVGTTTSADKTPLGAKSEVTITEANNSNYSLNIGSEAIVFNSDTDATKEEIVNGLKASFDANTALSATHTFTVTDASAGTFTIQSIATGESTSSVSDATTFEKDSSGTFESKNTIDAGTGKALSELKNLEAGQLSQAKAAEFQAVVDDAINDLNAYRGDIGSTQNQVESAVRNLMTQATNVKAAESIIRDVDYAAESSNFNKQNIIAQAGSYAISQANSAQKNVMKLLQ